MADENFEHWWDMDGKFYDGIDVEDAAHSASTAAIASQREEVEGLQKRIAELEFQRMKHDPEWCDSQMAAAYVKGASDMREAAANIVILGRDDNGDSMLFLFPGWAKSAIRALPIPAAQPRGTDRVTAPRLTLHDQHSHEIWGSCGMLLKQ